LQGFIEAGFNVVGSATKGGSDFFGFGHGVSWCWALILTAFHTGV
jgi:hypothetical protein